MVTKEYITQISYDFDGEPRTAYRIADTRVSLDSVVINWLNGESPESIVQNFPSLTLEQVYGALAFYLANRDEIDEYLRQGEIEFAKLSQQWNERVRKENPALYQKLMAAKQRKTEPATSSTT